MALKALEYLASALVMGCVYVFRMFGVSLGQYTTATPSSSRSRSIAQDMAIELRLPASMQKIVSAVVQYKRLDQDAVPGLIVNNPLWRCLSPYKKDVYMLCDSEAVTAILVLLRDTGIKVVLKAWSAGRVKDTDTITESDAELDAAASFAWHPSMATAVAACYDSDGNYCSAVPYAGCSLASLITHPDWYTTVSEQDRLDFIRLLLPHWMKVFHIMQHTGVGHFHRDVKPDNLTFDAVTGVGAVIDYGTKLLATKESYRRAYTSGYFTPEMVNPEGNFNTFRSTESLKQATNATTDVFLASYSALEVAVGLHGLPWVLQPGQHDLSTGKGYVQLLTEHAAAAADGYDALIARVSCPVARDFFAKTLCSDPTQRLTAAQALQHPWLAESVQIAEDVVAAVAPTYQQHNQQLVDLLSTLPEVIIPQQQHLVSQPVGDKHEDSQASPMQVDVEQSSPAGRSVSPANSLNNSESSRGSSSPTSGPLRSTSGRSSSSGGRSSVSSAEDTALMDQLTTAGASSHTEKGSSLLQRGKNLIKKTRRRRSASKAGKSSKASSQHTDGNGTRVAGNSKAPSTVESTVKVQTWIDDEPIRVAVPGLCGLRWFRQ